MTITKRKPEGFLPCKTCLRNKPKEQAGRMFGDRMQCITCMNLQIEREARQRAKQQKGAKNA